MSLHRVLRTGSSFPSGSLRGSVPPRRPRVFTGLRADAIKHMALRFLARQDRTEAQVRSYLGRKGAAASDIKEVVHHLLKCGYLDDAVYALRWARARLIRRPMGRERLESELIGQGIARTLVSRTLKQVFEERPESCLARNLLARRSGSRTPPSGARAAALLRRHGFAEDTIEHVIE